MRNRYIVIFLLLLTALTFAGCRKNPEKAKRKYFASGMKYMDDKQVRSRCHRVQEGPAGRPEVL